MSDIKTQLLFFLIQLVAIFFLSRTNINHLFYFFRFFIKNDKTIFLLLSLIFFPGTIIHELAHFFAATGLFLNVRDLQIFPHIEGKKIKLGKVIYEKKDFLRSILVGIAPLLAGFFFFFLLSFFQLFPANNFWQNLFFGYLIFVVSSRMFSSQKDLVDIVYVIPLFFILLGIIYVFDIQLDFIFKNNSWLGFFSVFVEKINFYLFLSLSINLFIFLPLSILRIILRKKRGNF